MFRHQSIATELQFFYLFNLAQFWPDDEWSVPLINMMYHIVANTSSVYFSCLLAFSIVILRNSLPSLPLNAWPARAVLEIGKCAQTETEQ
jgi:hypothetical protein